MKLDKFSIAGIALAAALLVFQLQYTKKNRARLEEERAKQEELNPVTPKADPVKQAASEEAKIATASLPENFSPEEITLKDEKAIFKFTTATGGISRVEILDQHEVNQYDVPVELNRFGQKNIGDLESLDGTSLEGGYQLLSQTERSISFLGQLSNGAIVKKDWTVFPEEEPGAAYRLKYKLTIENPTSNTIEASNINLFVGGAAPLYNKELPNQSGFFYLGGDGYTKKKSNPLKKNFYSSKLKTLEKGVDDLEFAGVGNQFFSCFFTPSEKYNSNLIARTKEIEIAEAAGGGVKNEISLAFTLPKESIAAQGGREEFNYEVYAGPKRYQTLKQLEPKGGLVMNYGFFKPISGVLNNILSFLYNKIFSKISGGLAWGLSIIALTVVIRVIMWPLHNVSARSMKRMNKLQPKIKELKEKYPDDPQRVGAEQMKLMGEYGINPMGGCLPMLGQIPIFFGLFTMLKSAVEFRHEKFLWIEDLSQPDHLFDIPVPFLEGGLPVNLLPILMLATMAIQMSMNPAPTDPTQKMVMRFMPVMMFVFCYNFASALALYWTTSNLFTIFQTWVVKKLPEPELKKKEKKAGKPGGFMERMQKQMEEMQKLQEQQKRGNGPMRDAKPKKKRGPRSGG